MKHQLRRLAALGSLALASLFFLSCGSSGGGGSSNSPVTTIGPSGGTFNGGNGLTVTVPAGALSSSVRITAGQTSTVAPSGYGALSGLYQFGPDGTTFAQPATVTLPLPAGAPPNVTIFWSQAGNPSAFDDVNGAVSGSSISARVTHFSTGFVGTLNSMAGWVHLDHRHWAYFVPTDAWIGTESTSGIDISSPTGDAVVSFVFAYGPLLPTTPDQVEALARANFSSFTIVSQSPITVGPLGGPSRTTEFTGVWLATHSNVHGIIQVDLGYQVIEVHAMIARPSIWSTISGTLQLIRDHITYLP
jgi:hypothetical protein